MVRQIEFDNLVLTIGWANIASGYFTSAIAENQSAQHHTMIRSQLFGLYFINRIFQMLSKLLDTATLLKAKITKNQLDEALVAATTEDNWQASTTVLHEIASSAFNHEKWERIREFIWKLLRNTNGWKKLLKALHIVQFLLKNGPTSAINHFRYEMGQFRILKNYQLRQEGVDRGAAIRQRAKIIVDLLQNDEMLEDERVRARQIRQKMSHLAGSSYSSVSSDSQGGSQKLNIPKYDSYNNSSLQANRDGNGFYNYGSGNYGNREDDRGHRQDYFQSANRFKKPEPEKPKPVPQQPQKNNATTFVKPVVQSPQKPKYETMAQKLMKNPTKPSQSKNEPVKPDLSYKNKDYEELLGPEVSFTNSKYDVHSASEYTIQPVSTQSTPKETQAPPTQNVNIISELDGFAFLGGGQVKPQQNNSINVNPVNPVVAAKVAEPTQPVSNTFMPANPINYSAPPPPVPIYNNYAYNNRPAYNNPQGYGYNTANNGYNQPNYYQNSYQQNSTNGSYGNPYYYQAQQPNSYYQPPATGGMYANPSIPAVPAHNWPLVQSPYAPVNPNPYANISESVISQITAVSNSPVQSPVKQKVEEDEFDNFKKSGNFDTEKISWMSNKQKTLTDLTDLNITMKKDGPTKQAKKEFSNNLKFDLWAW